MSFVGGLVGQAGRNVVLEPWRANSRAADGTTRAGELTADGLFVAGGGAAAVTGLRLARSASSPLAKAGALLLAGVGTLAAVTGVKNLFATLPTGPAPGPTPTPTPEPKPEPTPPPVDPEPPVDPDPPVDPPVDPPPAPKPEPPDELGPATRLVSHKVRPGETLTFIADCYLADWRELYAFNRDTIGPNPDILRVGARLVIPPKDYDGPSFSYQPSRPAGTLPADLECLPESPKAKLDTCDR